ncbi:MAG: hypothetical protein ABIE47_12970 [Pseudomonadota bacterium]
MMIMDLGGVGASWVWAPATCHRWIGGLQVGSLPFLLGAVDVTMASAVEIWIMDVWVLMARAWV